MFLGILVDFHGHVNVVFEGKEKKNINIIVTFFMSFIIYTLQVSFMKTDAAILFCFMLQLSTSINETKYVHGKECITSKLLLFSGCSCIL